MFCAFVLTKRELTVAFLVSSQDRLPSKIPDLSSKLDAGKRSVVPKTLVGSGIGVGVNKFEAVKALDWGNA
jgi:hypothetical protein